MSNELQVTNNSTPTRDNVKEKKDNKNKKGTIHCAPTPESYFFYAIREKSYEF